MKNIFIVVIHCQMSQLFKLVSYNVDLLPTNAKLGRIMRIMELIFGCWSPVRSEYSNIRY